MKRTLLLISVAAALGGAAPATASAAEFEGTVTSINRDARTFRLQDDETGRTRTIRVTSRTRWQRVRWSTLRVGARDIEAIVKRVDGRWVASFVEVSGKNRDD